MRAWYVGSIVFVRWIEWDKIYMMDVDTWLLDYVALRETNINPPNK